MVDPLLAGPRPDSEPPLGEAGENLEPEGPLVPRRGSLQNSARSPLNGFAHGIAVSSCRGFGEIRVSDNDGNDIVNRLENSDQADIGCANGLSARPRRAARVAAALPRGRRAKGWTG